MLLSPSQIHFTSGIDNLGASKMAADSHISDVYSEMRITREYPRLQVVKKCGQYFTLDNTRLYMLRRMEEEGHCKLVSVDKVLLKKVPEAVQKMMVVPTDLEEPQIKPERKRFLLRRASELILLGSPRKVKHSRDSRSVPCSLETGRRKLQPRAKEVDNSSESSCENICLDEKITLL